MHIRPGRSIASLSPWLILVSLAACGNHGAPPYAPDASTAPSPAAPAAAQASPSTAAPTAAATGVAAARSDAGADPHVLYDLREKCGEDARRWYQHFYEETGAHRKQPQVSHGFTSHYNARLNDCFALTSSIGSIEEIKSRVAKVVEAQNLSGVLENKNIGIFLIEADATAPAECRVADQVCKSREEWESLTARYMTE
jgi:predicted small lipoprotein YifL